MTDRPFRDAELDAAIDRAVRDLMGAEPRADLRERVLSELDGTSARARLWPRFAFGLAAAAAALVIIAVQFAERPSERPVEHTIAALPAAERPRTDGTPLTPGVSPRVPPGTPGRASGPLAPAPGRDSIVENRPIQAASVEEPSALGIAPMTPVARLSPIEPIAVSRLEASVIPAPPIDIKPLAIEQMEIAPLTPPR